MRTVNRALAIGALLVLIVDAGCTLPAETLLVKTSAPATVSLRLIAGTALAQPAACETPCVVAIPSGSTFELSVEAQGYYPATMNVDRWQVVYSPRDGDQHSLYLPLLPVTSSDAR